MHLKSKSIEHNKIVLKIKIKYHIAATCDYYSRLVETDSLAGVPIRQFRHDNVKGSGRITHSHPTPHVLHIRTYKSIK